MNIVQAVIHHGRVGASVFGQGIEEVLHRRDQEGGISSVKEAIMLRLLAWPAGKFTGAGVAVLTDTHLAAMRILDRAFIMRCPFSMVQIEVILGVEDTNTFEQI